MDLDQAAYNAMVQRRLRIISVLAPWLAVAGVWKTTEIIVWLWNLML